jgi:heme-degrading monooxygenase HmoA
VGRDPSLSDTQEQAESAGVTQGAVVVISTFRVANGMEGAVRQAFLDRPGLVDDAPGFLGMEVLLDHQDDSIFHLLTRWTDESSFKSWHPGPLHKLAHRGIPKGLKLDPAYTAVRTLYALAGDAGPESAVSEEALIARLPRFLAHTRSFHWMKASFDGWILAANPAFELLLQESCKTLPGQSLWDRVTQVDAASIRAILKSDNIDSEDPVLLNFVSRDQSVQTLECHIEVRSRDFVLVGEPVPEHDRALAKELLELNIHRLEAVDV